MKKGTLRRIKAYAVLLPDDNGVLLPVVLTFKLRSLLMDNIPRGKKGKVVDVTISFRT